MSPYSLMTTLMKMLLASLIMISCATAANSKLAYYGLEPDIVTNYVSPDDSRLGYVRLTVELMIEDYQYLQDIEHHSPLLRATIIEVFGKQSEGQVKSLVGREDIRRSRVTRLKQIMKRETGQAVVKDVIFTKYLYEG